MPHKPGHLKPFTNFLTQGMQNTSQNIANINQPQFQPFSNSLANSNINTFKIPNQFSQNQGGGNNFMGTEAGWSGGVEGETEGEWNPGTVQDPISLADPDVSDDGIDNDGDGVVDEEDEVGSEIFTQYAQWWQDGDYKQGVMPLISASQAMNPLLYSLMQAPGSNFNHTGIVSLSDVSTESVNNMNNKESQLINNYANNELLTSDYAPGSNTPYGSIVENSPFGDGSNPTTMTELNQWQNNEFDQIMATGSGSDDSDFFNQATKLLAFQGTGPGDGSAQDVINVESGKALERAEESMLGMPNEQQVDFYQNILTSPPLEGFQTSLGNIESSFGVTLPDWSTEYPFFGSLDEVPPMMMYNIQDMVEQGSGIQDILGMINTYMQEPPNLEEDEFIEDYIGGNIDSGNLASGKRFAKKLYFPGQDDSGFTAVGEGLSEEILEKMKNM
mgnify:CR=1 FL=1